jgi:repressor LexA
MHDLNYDNCEIKVYKYVEENQMEVKDILKTRRLELGYTLEDVARKVGTNSSTVLRWENGEISNMRRDKIMKLAQALEISPAVIMEWDLPPAPNLSTPAAYPIPILGRISCGPGTFQTELGAGEFFVDRSIRADYCLEARGDSMTDAGIDNGDKVFLRKTDDYVDGKIYGVVIRGEDLAVLKKVYHIDKKVMLQSCNDRYAPLLVSQEDVCIVGECVGVYKSL